MEACWEYLGCSKTQCVMHGRRDAHCWEVEGTLCNNIAIEFLRRESGRDKTEACAHSRCMYFEFARHWIPELR